MSDGSTDQVSASERLSDRRLQALIEASPEVLYRMSPDWGEMRELVGSGFLPDTHDGNRAWLLDYIPAEDRAMVTAAIDEAIRTKTTFNLEHRVRQADGGIGWTLSRAVPVFNDAGEILEWAGAASNVTVRHEAKQQLRDLNASLANLLQDQRALLQQMPGFVAVVSGPDHTFEYVNDAYKALVGARDYIGHTVREVLPDLAGQGFFELLDRTYETGDASRVEASRVRFAREDTDRYINFIYQPIRGTGGSVTGVFVGGYEITEQIRGRFFADALIAITDRIANVTDPDEVSFAAATVIGETLKTSRVGYGTIDPETETLHVERDWNAPGVETLAGVTPLRDYGEFIDTLKRGEFIAIDDVTQDERTASAAAALQGRSSFSFMNVPILEQGQLVAVLYVNNGWVRTWLPDEMTFVREAASRIRAAVERCRNENALRDLNATLHERIEAALREQALTEEALRQAQKMEAVGQLTGGLAHDFNNLLTGMMGNLELLQLRVSRGRLDDLDRFINAAQGAGRRAATLTQRLLAFSRRQTLDPKPTDVNRLIAGLEEMLHRTVGASANIEVVGAVGLWTTYIDAAQLENAILNLCINGRDAMPDGGKLTIETANRWIDDRAARDRDILPGQYVSVCVTDTGTGMSPETIQRAFEPFYTTKPLGQGTGLGLSMIYGFAKQSGGQVRIYSEVGQGTTVCIYLPRHHGDAPEEIEGVGADLRPSAGAQTVLVVDDEATIRHLIDEVLDDLGYTVIGAADGAAGIKVLQSGARIELLITDVGLPNGMNGRQVADAARALRPGLKVLFITGFAENATVGNGHLEPGMELLTKPFTLEALSMKVAEMLRPAAT